MEKIKCTEMCNDVVLNRIKKSRTLIDIILKRKGGCIGHILRVIGQRTVLENTAKGERREEGKEEN